MIQCKVSFSSPKRWRSRFHPLSSGHGSLNHPKKVTVWITRNLEIDREFVALISWQLVLAGLREVSSWWELTVRAVVAGKSTTLTKGEAENVTSIWVIKNGTNGRSWFMALFEFSKLVWCFLIIFFFGAHQILGDFLQPPFSLRCQKLLRVLCRLLSWVKNSLQGF